MITPMDIHNKEFKKGFRGYSEEDVDTFMSQVASDYELIYRDNRELKDAIDQLREKIRHYEQMESTMNNTLVLAQETAENVKAAARKEADIIVQGAEQERRNLLDDTTRSLREAQEKYEALRQETAVFRAKMQSILQAQLKLVDEMVLGESKQDSEELKKTLADTEALYLDETKVLTPVVEALEEVAVVEEVALEQPVLEEDK